MVKYVETAYGADADSDDVIALKCASCLEQLSKHVTCECYECGYKEVRCPTCAVAKDRHEFGEGTEDCGGLIAPA